MLNFEIIVDWTDRQNMRLLRLFRDSCSFPFAPDKFHQTKLQLSWHTRLSILPNCAISSARYEYSVCSCSARPHRICTQHALVRHFSLGFSVSNVVTFLLSPRVMCAHMHYVRTKTREKKNVGLNLSHTIENLCYYAAIVRVSLSTMCLSLACTHSVRHRIRNDVRCYALFFHFFSSRFDSIQLVPRVKSGDDGRSSMQHE